MGLSLWWRFSTGLHTFQQHSRGERLTVTIYFDVLAGWVCWLFSPLTMLPSIHGMLDRTCSFLHHFFWGIISVANVSLKLAAILVICPLFFGWSLHICTTKLFAVKIPQKLQLLFASSFAFYCPSLAYWGRLYEAALLTFQSSSPEE